MRLFLLVVLVFVGIASSFNHPDIRWKTVETEHFRIHYYDRTEPVVYAVWKTADEVMNALSDVYDYRSRGKINICLADYDDYSNGWADYLSGNVMIWIPDSRYQMRDNNTWLRNVVTHELVHIITLEKSSTFFDASVNLNVRTPNSQIRLQEPFGYQTAFSSWLYEGVAQLETKKMGNDCWDSRRDMVLRMAALSGTLLTLDQMGQFSHDSYGNEMVYNQGFSFTRYLDKKMGSEKFRHMWTKASREKISPANYIRSASGESLQSLYKKWADSITASYRKGKPEDVSRLKTVWERGYVNTQPKMSTCGTYTGFLTSAGDDANRTELRLEQKGSGSVTLREVHTAWDFGADRKVYYVKSDQPSKNGSFFNNLFSYDLQSRKKRQLTKDGRIYGVAASPDGDRLACIRFSSAKYSIQEYDPETRTFTSLYQGIPGEQIMDLSYDPSGTGRIIFSRLVGGMSRLFLLERDGVSKPLGPGVSQETSPFWADNGRVYYSADYDGIYNIYSLSPDSAGTPVRHSTVVGGLFCPYLRDDGKLLVSSYDENGFSVSVLTPDQEAYVPKGDGRCAFEPLPVAEGVVRIHSKPYRAQKLRPTRRMAFDIEYFKDTPLDVSPDSFSATLAASFLSSSSDALEKKQRFWRITAGLAGESVQDTIEEVSPGLRSSSGEFRLKEVSGKSSIRSFRSEQFHRALGANPSFSNGTADENTESSGGIQNGAYLPFIMPSAGWESNEFTFSSGFSSSLILAPSVLPQVIAEGYLHKEISSELSAGADLESFWVVLPGLPVPVSSIIPLNLTYRDMGKYDRYSRYNSSDATYLSLYGGPGYILYARNDSTAEFIGKLLGGIAFRHGFPLWKSASVVLHTDQEVELFGSSVEQESLDGESDLFFTSSSGVNLNVPLLKINSGSYWYMDALFANVGYSLSMRGNRNSFDSESFESALWTDGDHDLSRLKTAHYLSGGLRMGIYKNAQYSRMLSLQLNYELLRSDLSVSLGLTF